MKKIYQSPSMDVLGAVDTITAALGSDPSPDISEASQPSAQGSFDICQRPGQRDCGDYSITW